MKAYLCQTELGPQYIHLQAEAKKLDPSFQTVEIDTAKEALLTMLNALLRDRDTPVQQSEDIKPILEEVKVSHKRSSKVVSRTYEQIDVEEFIFAIPEAESYRLNQIQVILDERKRELCRTETR